MNRGCDIESTNSFFLHCHFFINERQTLLTIINSIDIKFLVNANSDLTQTLLFGNDSHDLNNNCNIINTSIKYILSNKRFDESLL